MRPNHWAAWVCRVWIWLVGLIVDQNKRSGWRLEWEAEIEHARSALRAKRHRAPTFRLVRRCACALGDALSLRKLERHSPEDARFNHGARRAAFFFDVLQDLAYGFRGLRRAPAFGLTAVLTVALGIGATTAVFSVVQAVLVAPLPHEDADQLVVIWETDLRYTPPATKVNVTPGNFADWRSEARSFEGLAAYSIGRGTVSGDGEPEMVTRAWVTSDFLPLLRARPTVGRSFAEGEDAPGTNPVVLLSHGFWQARFGGDAGAVGRTLTLNGNEFEIVGVLEPEVDFLAQGIQIWTPYVLPSSERENRRQHYLNVLARMLPGVSREQAQVEMETIADRIRLEHPEWMTQRGVNVVPLRDQIIGNARLTLLVLFGAVLAVLLIAAVNVANLLMVRATARRQEFAVRSALGAGRSRLIRQSLAESLTISILGGGAGVVAATFGTDALFALAPANLQRAAAVGVNLPVLTFALALSVLTGVVFGLIPALQSSLHACNGALTAASRWAGSSDRSRIRQFLVIGELAISMTLLIGAGLLTQTFWRLASIDRGFESQRLLTASLRLPQASYPDAQRATSFYDEMLQRVRALPQVNSAGLTRFLPLSDGPWTFSIEVEGMPTPPESERRTYAYQPVSTDYFRTAGITLLGGRDFTPSDNADAVPVVIINEAMKRLFWPNSDPIGGQIRFDRDSDDPSWRRIIGVVQDVRHDGPRSDARPTIYGPQQQAAAYLLDRTRLVVRTASDPLLVVRDIRQIVYGLDPNLVVFDIRTMEQLVANSVSQPKFAMVLVLGFAIVAGVLSLIGIFGVISYTVSQRLPELGLRIAFGAQAGKIGTQVVLHGIALAGLGVGIGVLGALGCTRVLDSLLFETSATDPFTYLVVSLLLTVAAATASYIPARRAASADPTVVMKGE